MSIQLPLGVRLRDDATLASFYPGPNQALVAAMETFLAPGSSEFVLYCWGGAGSGKTHLLQAACHQIADKGENSLYIPLSSALFHGPEMLTGLEGLSLVCIDDLQTIAADKVWQEAVFHLFNRLRESGGKLLVAADNTPGQLPLTMPDLLSRLAWGLIFQVQPLMDQDKLMALQWRAKARGLALGDDAGWFLLRRYSRDMHQLYEVLDKLDEASLVYQRRLTIPFVKEVLAI